VTACSTEKAKRKASKEKEQKCGEHGSVTNNKEPQPQQQQQQQE
jgi:hypothetical protein